MDPPKIQSPAVLPRPKFRPDEEQFFCSSDTVRLACTLVLARWEAEHYKMALLLPMK